MAEKSQKKRERGSSIEIIDLENPKSSTSFGDLIDLTTTDDDDADKILEIKSINKNPNSGMVINEIGEFSGSKKKKKVEESFVCEICVETKVIKESFEIKGCGHSYCSECMVRYVQSKIEENVISIGCPEMNCQGVLEPEICQSILPTEVFDRWGKALWEAVILGTQKFYCPFKDCSALLHNEGGRKKNITIRMPHCNRLFCAQCKVPWHSGIKCARFQLLNVDESEREEILLLMKAANKKWQRCPNCKVFVEKRSGCRHMICRCLHSFCFKCGGTLGSRSYLTPTTFSGKNCSC